MKTKTQVAVVLILFAFWAVGCGTTQYYKIIDPASGNTYYAKDAEIKEKGAVEFVAARTNNKMKLDAAKVQGISKEEFDMAVTGTAGSSAVIMEQAPVKEAKIVKGRVVLFNSCKYALTIYSNPNYNLGQLEPNTGTSVPVSGLNAGGPNVIMPYPNLTEKQSPNCDKWTALGGTPGTKQREGYMWEGKNAVYAAYCNPNLSGRGICALQKNCCGPGMVQDGTFGTHLEITPQAYGGNDFVNLSTNYGSGPHSPPQCCNCGDDCVSKASNIFFNVPIKWTTNEDCSFTTKGKKVKSLQCLAVSCPNAYQHPTDDKQCACSTDLTGRGYLVEFCPKGSPLPSPN